MNINRFVTSVTKRTHDVTFDAFNVNGRRRPISTVDARDYYNPLPPLFFNISPKLSFIPPCTSNNAAFEAHVSKSILTFRAITPNQIRETNHLR